MSKGKEPVYPIGGDGALNTGLTKLEYFAAHANVNPYHGDDVAAKRAVSYAKALIKALEEAEKE